MSCCVQSIRRLCLQPAIAVLLLRPIKNDSLPPSGRTRNCGISSGDVRHQTSRRQCIMIKIRASKRMRRTWFRNSCSYTHNDQRAHRQRFASIGKLLIFNEHFRIQITINSRYWRIEWASDTFASARKMVQRLMKISDITALGTVPANEEDRHLPFEMNH
jgi:hypothetical protein